MNLLQDLAMTPAELARLREKGLIKSPAPVVQVAVNTTVPRKKRERAEGSEKSRRMTVYINEETPAQISHSGLAAAELEKVESKWVDITPKMAGEWLRNNFQNRKVKQDVIDAYARDMRNGKWKTTHQGIAFNDRDELIDGQHRLMAILASGITVRMMVTFNLPARTEGEDLTTMDCVDRGRTRSVADQLTIQHGFKNANLTASICAALASLCCKKRTRRVNVGEALAIFRQFQEQILWVIDNRSKEHGLKSAGVLAGFVFALAVDGEVVGKMFRAMNRNEVLHNMPVIQMLRDFLTSDQAVLINHSMDRGLSELTLNAINLQMRGSVPEVLLVEAEGMEHYRCCQSERVQQVAALFGVKE